MAAANTVTTKEDIIRELLEESSRSIKTGVQGLKQKLWSKSQRFVLSSQVWLHAIPTQHCDVLVTLPPKDSRAEFVITWLVQKIREKEPRLVMELRYHSVMDSYGLYLSAKFENLMKGAEELHIRKRLKEQWGGGHREFTFDQQDCYAGVEGRGQFFTSQERATIVLHFLQGVRANNNDTLGGISFREGQSVVPTLVDAGFISQILPLHNSEQLKRLQDTWVKQAVAPQPLDDICDYFGVKIAMYFAWLGFYTLALSVPAFFGFIYWLFFIGGHQLSEDVCFVAFALLNIIWASVVVEWWKRLQAEHAYRWGTLGMETNFLVEPRPFFRGELSVSLVTGRLEPYYPGWKRRLIRYCFSFPLTLLCLFVVFLVMLLVFELQEVTNKHVSETSFLVNWILFLPKFILALVIYVAAEFYTKFAVWLNDIENYRTDERYEYHLIHKIVLFQVVNSFLPLFYIAFYLQDMERLKVQLAALLITRQVIGNFQEAVVPFVMEKLKLSSMTYRMTRTMSDSTLQRHIENIKQIRQAEQQDHSSSSLLVPDEDSSPDTVVVRRKMTTNTDRLPLPEFKITGSQLSQAEVESLLPKYTSPLEDYLEMFIQFGYVLLFSPAFPLAALCCLVNNILEIRVDAFKLCTTMQRPFGQRVESIGAWQMCIELMGVVGVIVNCVLIAQSGLVQRFWPDLSWGGHILIVVLMEHFILLLKFVISRAIPDIPNWVTIEMSKVEFKRREAFRKESRMIMKQKPEEDFESRPQTLHSGGSNSKVRS